MSVGFRRWTKLVAAACSVGSLFSMLALLSSSMDSAIGFWRLREERQVLFDAVFEDQELVFLRGR